MENQDEPEKPKQHKWVDEGKVLKDIKKAHQTWHRMAIGLRWLQVILGIIAVLSSITIVVLAKAKCTLNCEYDVWLSGLAAISITLLSAFGIIQKGNNSRNAWRYLQTHILLFYAGKIDIESLIRAYEEAERIMGSVDFSYQVPPSSGPKPS